MKLQIGIYLAQARVLGIKKICRGTPKDELLYYIYILFFLFTYLLGSKNKEK